jgi:hypothetical protein
MLARPWSANPPAAFGEQADNLGSVTKVQLHYQLLRPLAAEDAEGISKAHGYYGIMRIQVAPRLDAITVDYDASRLSEKDVEAALHRYGVPVARKWVLA